MKSLPAIVIFLISAILLSCDKGAPKAEAAQTKLKTTYVVNETVAVQTPEKEPIKKNRKL